MGADPQDATSGVSDAELGYLAYHDALTGLPNRRLLEEHLDVALTQAEQERQAVALLYIDLDGFKRVNDDLGHDVAHRLLGGLAGRLIEVVRFGDLVARQGGDEFLFMLPGIEAHAGGDLEQAAREAARACAARILEQTEAPFAIDDAVLHVNASVGVGLYPFDARDADTLCQQADAAMYEAKTRGGIAHFTPGVASPLGRLSRARHLRAALEDGRFELHYQPVLELPGARLVGVEALLRLDDGAGGLIPPLDFIPAAEKTGVIHELGAWVAGELCRQGREWRDEGLAPELALNVSAVQLQRADFARSLHEAAASNGIDPRDIVVELTESAWVVDGTRTLPALAAIRAAGFRLALDDFGAGFSSLTRLRALPADILKVDRAFMAGVPEDPQAVAIVAAILGLAAACRCEVVMEGVGSEAQARFLPEIGCGRAQGFHFARPMATREMTALLREAAGNGSAPSAQPSTQDTRGGDR